MAKKILIVEDDRVLCQVMSEKLLKEGFEVVLAFNGEEGLAKVSSEKPDLVLLDIVMPKMDGLDMLGKLRDANNDVPVIMLTNLNESDKIAKACQEKCSGYLVKSNYSLEDVVEIINENV